MLSPDGPSAGVRLVCPVRGCGRPLSWGEPVMACAAGHSFDRARGGHYNLLQPQDRRAAEPGDAAAAVAARRRTFDRGLLAHVSEALIAAVSDAIAEDTASGARAGVLDVGCGEGSHLAALAAGLPIDAWGVDLSRAGIEAASRRHRSAGAERASPRFLIANADRRLPFADGSFAVITTITGPKHAPELHRLLRPGGTLLVGTPGPDDLAEARAVMFSEVHALGRAHRMEEIFGAHFDLIATTDLRHRARVDAAALADLCATTYRAARERERARLAAIESLDVTLSLRLLAFRAKARGSGQTRVPGSPFIQE